MRLTLLRVLLDPLTSWRTLRLRREAPTAAPVSFDAAWRRARMISAPDEMVFRLHGHHFPADREQDKPTRS
ncbi:hypothetical protein ACWGI1_24735 [Streptomyces sp. NPDC054835]